MASVDSIFFFGLPFLGFSLGLAALNVFSLPRAATAAVTALALLSGVATFGSFDARSSLLSSCLSVVFCCLLTRPVATTGVVFFLLEFKPLFAPPLLGPASSLSLLSSSAFSLIDFILSLSSFSIFFRAFVKAGSCPVLLGIITLGAGLPGFMSYLSFMPLIMFLA